MWDFRIDPNNNAWVKHEIDDKSAAFAPSKNFFENTVTTIEIAKVLKIAELLYRQKIPVMLTGHRSVGKTTIANMLLDKISCKNVATVQVNFSYYTKSHQMQVLSMFAFQIRQI